MRRVSAKQRSPLHHLRCDTVLQVKTRTPRHLRNARRTPMSAAFVQQRLHIGR